MVIFTSKNTLTEHIYSSTPRKIDKHLSCVPKANEAIGLL